MAGNRLYGPVGAPGAAGALGLNTPGGIAAVLPVTQVVVVNTETLVMNPSVPTQPLLVTVPANSPLEGKPWILEPSGTIETGTSSTVTLKVYEGTAIVSGNLMGSSGAVSAFSGKTPYTITSKLQFDSTSGKLTGTIEFNVNNTIVAKVAISNVLTGISNENNPVLQFCMSVTFGTANAGNTIIVDDLPINF